MASFNNITQGGIDNKFEKDMQEVLSEDDDYGNMAGGDTGPRRSQSHPGGERPAPPSSLAIMPGEEREVQQSWTGGLAQGCAPVFQPFGEPTSSTIPLQTPTPGEPGRNNKLEFKAPAVFSHESQTSEDI